MVMLMSALTIVADDYPYLTFETQDGSVKSVSTTSLTLTISGNELIVNDGACSFQPPNTTTSSQGGGPGGQNSSKIVVYTSSTPSLTSDVSVSGGTEYFAGMANFGCTVSGGQSVSLSNYTSSGGGPGGGRW